jgi:hypothetical protein
VRKHPSVFTVMDLRKGVGLTHQPPSTTSSGGSQRHQHAHPPPLLLRATPAHLASGSSLPVASAKSSSSSRSAAQTSSCPHARSKRQPGAPGRRWLGDSAQWRVITAMPRRKAPAPISSAVHVPPSSSGPREQRSRPRPRSGRRLPSTRCPGGGTPRGPEDDDAL